MKSTGIQASLCLLSAMCGTNGDREGEDIAIAAQAELAELTKLVSVVKGFVESIGYIHMDDLCNTLRDDGYVEVPEFIKDICGCVGYKV